MAVVAWLAAAYLGASADAAQLAFTAALRRPDRTFTVAFAAPELPVEGPGQPAEAHVAVRLPGAYASCVKPKASCWLLVYLPGFDSSADEALQMIGPALDALEARGETPPVVAVALDGRTRLGGGWYVDSVQSGHWEHLVVDGLLPAARQVLLAAPPERTVVIGHSMGGFGALRLAEHHPGMFSGVGALNPILRPEELAEFCLARLATPLLADGGLSAPTLGAPLGGGGFCPRLVASLVTAFAPEGSRGPPERALRWGDAHAWQLATGMRIALTMEDLIQPEPLSKVVHLFATTGARDPLSLPGDLEALAQASGGGDFASVRTRVTPGDHTSHRAEDFADAVRYLTAAAASGGAGPR
jgi:pimeloyl-ACP methyl ester carboxylesterase